MKIALGLVGTNGAGKSTACKLLEKEGYTKISLSDFLRDIVSKKGLPLDRDTLTSEANSIKEKEGLDYFAKMAVAFAEQNNVENVVFDSVRHPDEVLYLKSKGVVFLGIDAPLSLRFERITSRMTATDLVDLETFKRQDNYERFGDSSGQNIEACLHHCARVITNTGSTETLLTQLHAVIGDALNASTHH